MGNKFKLLEKVRNGKRNVRPATLRKLMTDFGFESKKTKHQILYSLAAFNIRASVVEHREKGQEGNVLECYVKNCLSAIDELLLIIGAENEK